VEYTCDHEFHPRRCDGSGLIPVASTELYARGGGGPLVKPCPGCPNCSPDPEPEFLTAWSRSDKVSIGTGTAPLPQSAPSSLT
jgi:hypothetical protein